jgi:hypothetical protein
VRHNNKTAPEKTFDPRKKSVTDKSKGTVLVEFAILIPVFFILIYYVHDAFRFVKTKKRVELCANCAVNMIQNNNRKVTLKDITNISCAAFVPYFGGGEKQYATANTVYGHSSVVTLFYIKGTGTNTAKIMWYVGQSGLGNPKNRSFWKKTSGTVAGWTRFAVGLPINTEHSVELIKKGLTINNEEVKMILVSYLYIDESFLMPNKINIKSTPSLWGFLTLDPKADRVNGSQRSYFEAIVVFSPKPGLFDDSGPQ